MSNEDNPILWGAEAIAKAIGVKNRKTIYHMIDVGDIKVGMKNGKLCITKADLLKQFELALIEKVKKDKESGG